MVKRFLVLALALIAGAALAVDARSGDTVLLTSPTAGTMIGVGSVQDGTLALRILGDFDGFARMTVRSTDGVSVTYDVFLDANGIQVIQGSTVRDLQSALDSAGITVSVQGVDAEAVRDIAATFDGARGDDDADDFGDDDGDRDDDGRDDDDDRDDGARDDDEDDGRDDDDDRDDGDDVDDDGDRDEDDDDNDDNGDDDEDDDDGDDDDGDDD